MTAMPRTVSRRSHWRGLGSRSPGRKVTTTCTVKDQVRNRWPAPKIHCPCTRDGHAQPSNAVQLQVAGRLGGLRPVSINGCTPEPIAVRSRKVGLAFRPTPLSNHPCTGFPPRAIVNCGKEHDDRTAPSLALTRTKGIDNHGSASSLRPG
jgi:hypothetical protein